jgi:hypothetical protein
MTNAAHHNVPLINGSAQPNGRQYQASEVTYASKASRSSIAMELKHAYGEDVGVKQLIRTLTHYKGKEVHLDDSIELIEIGNVSEILMTTYKPDLSKSGEIVLHLQNETDEGKQFLISYDAKLLEPSFRKMAMDEPEDAAIMSYWGKDVYRLELKSRSPFTKEKIRMKFAVK